MTPTHNRIRSCHASAAAAPHSMLDMADQLATFVKQQKKRTSVQSVKQQWLLTDSKLSSSRARVEGELLSMLTSLAASETAGIPSCHTQLLVYRQEWDELQHDVLEKVTQCIQKRHAQPFRQMSKLVQQQHNQNLAALGSLDSAKSAAHAELIADWPTALDSSDIEHQLPKLHDDIQLLCQQHQTAATDIRQGLQREAANLQAGFQQRLEECQQNQHSHDLSAYARNKSDWSQECQELLLQMSQHFKADPLAPSRESMHEYMQAMLPGKSVSDIAGHHHWHWQKRMMDIRLKDLFRAWDKACQIFLRDAKRLLSQSVKQQAAFAKSAADRLKCLTVQTELHGELKVLRCERYVQEAMDALAADTLEQAQAERQAEEARQLQWRTQHNKDQLVLYYKAQEAAKAEAQAAAVVKAEQDAVQAQWQSQQNQERVCFRQSETAQKGLLKTEQAMMVLCTEQRKNERLDRLRAQVQVHVEADPERAMAATVASSAQEAEHEKAFASVHGYTTDELLKDKRFKVLEALRQQSLHTTGYAKQALLAVSPAVLPRRDTLTSMVTD